jgi:16S rRNA (uracil1498-N3)-methyltransferase
MYEFSDDNSDYQYDNTNGNVSLLIGPEGGFTGNEIESLRNSNWQIKSLGSRKLRAETAAIVSLFDILSKLK